MQGVIHILPANPFLFLFARVGFCKLQSKKSWQIHLWVSYLNLSYSLLLHFLKCQEEIMPTWQDGAWMKWDGIVMSLAQCPTHGRHKKWWLWSRWMLFTLSANKPCLGVIPFQAPPRSHSFFRGNLAAWRFIKKRQTQKWKRVKMSQDLKSIEETGRELWGSWRGLLGGNGEQRVEVEVKRQLR